jgi:hypothetical protein
MVSLYVCDIPQGVERESLEQLFKDLEGFIEVRVARDRNK